MNTDGCQPVSVSRTIEAPAEEVFGILADPARHVSIDGSGMLKQAVSTAIIENVGDAFILPAHSSKERSPVAGEHDQYVEEARSAVL